VPYWINYPIWAWRISASFLATFVAIYLTLDRDGHLPHETFMRNVMQIGAVIGLLTGVAAAVFITAKILSFVYVAGIIWNMFAGVIFFFVQYSLMTNMLDFRIRDFVWLYLFYFPVTEAMVLIIGLFLEWGLFSLVT